MGAGNSILKSNKTEKKEQLVSSKFKGSFGCGLSDNKFFFLFPKHYNFFQQNTTMWSFLWVFCPYLWKKSQLTLAFSGMLLLTDVEKCICLKLKIYLSKWKNVFVFMCYVRKAGLCWRSQACCCWLTLRVSGKCCKRGKFTGRWLFSGWSEKGFCKQYEICIIKMTNRP